MFKEATLTFSNNWTLFWPYNSETLRIDYNGNSPMAYIDSILVKDDKGGERELDELQMLVRAYLSNDKKISWDEIAYQTALTR